jgi:hypothetical protein
MESRIIKQIGATTGSAVPNIIQVRGIDSCQVVQVQRRAGYSSDIYRISSKLMTGEEYDKSERVVDITRFPHIDISCKTPKATSFVASRISEL